MPKTGRRFKAIVVAAVKEPVIDVPLLVELLRRADGMRLGEIDRMRGQHRSDMYVNGERIRREAAEGGLNESTRNRLELLARVETAIGRKLTDYAWADDQVTPLELASALADVGDQVAQARKRKAIADMHGNLAQVARAVVRDLDKLA